MHSLNFKYTPLITTFWVITINIKLLFSSVNRKIAVAKKEVIPNVDVLTGPGSKLMPPASIRMNLKYGLYLFKWTFN